MKNTQLISGLLLTIFIVSTTIALLGCQPPPQADDTGATEEDTETFTDANNQFAFDLYKKYKNNEGNIFFSPFLGRHKNAHRHELY